MVKLVCHDDLVAGIGDTWATSFLASSCKIRAPNAGAEVLGAPVGDDAFVADFVQAKVDKIQLLHAALRELEHPAAELVLGRCCTEQGVWNTKMKRFCAPPFQSLD